MDEQLYKVVFRGEILKGRDPDEVKAELAVLFKTTPERVEKLFSGNPVVIANKVNGQQAQKYKDALEKAGAGCEVCAVEEKEPAGSERRELADDRGSGALNSKKGSCPRCGAELTGSPECPKCGIIIEKYLARQAQERQGTGIPAKAAVSAAETKPKGMGANRNRLIYPLVAVLVLVAGFVFWKLHPGNPPKEHLLELANKMIANMEAYGNVIEETDDFRKTRDFMRSGQANSGDQFIFGMTLTQFQQAMKLSTEEIEGVVSVKNIEAALREANVAEGVRKSNEVILAEMDKLKDAAEGCSKEFKPVITGLQALHKTYAQFTDLALAPGKHKTLAGYCGKYSVRKILMASLFDGWVKLVNELKEPPKSQDRWVKEYNAALEGIQRLKE